jgi:hypothetical protein
VALAVGDLQRGELLARLLHLCGMEVRHLLLAYTAQEEESSSEEENSMKKASQGKATH